jgi:hypothetical protein
MEPFTILKTTVRRFVLGRQGLWAGRRWEGKDGVAQALRAVEAVQMDPLNVVARNHDIVLWGRVAGYRPEYLDDLLYRERLFFDYGGGLFIYPMFELPYWRVPMRRRQSEARWAKFAAEHQPLLDAVCDELRTRGPLGNRDFTGGARVSNYRGRKETSLALYYLWLTGELMIHHREGFERVYDFRDNIAPPDLNYAATDEEAEHFFARKAAAFIGLISERGWKNTFSGFIERRVSRVEAQQWLDRLVREGAFAPIRLRDSKDRWFVLQNDLPLLAAIEADEIPAEWQLCETTTRDEAVFLAPLDIVSTRGRAGWLFDFEYLWEVYKPAAARRWGYYTLPILYDDRLVARLDPKFDRATAMLHLNGFWFEEHAPASDPAFAAALARGLVRFATFLGAQHVDIAQIVPLELQTRVKDIVSASFDVQA